MSKRKRGDLGHNGIRQEAPLEIQQKRIQEKVHYGIKLLHRALKVAKGFERQKLSKRIKNARRENDENTIKRLNREHEALKTLDLMSLAENHTGKIISKNKSLSSCPALPDSMRELSLHTIADDASANVAARLLNTNQAKDAVTSAISSLLAVIGIRPPHKKVSESNKMLEARASSSEGSMPRDSGNANFLMRTHDESESDYLDVDKRDRGMAVPDTDEEFTKADDDRIGSSWSDTSLDPKQETVPVRYNAAVDRNLTPSPSPSESPEPLAKRHNNSTKDKKPVDSNFLPSLTMGGYWSGSESEPEDDAPDLAPRKNRRGQRARQAIWEKKYGKGAKHLQKSKIKGDQRDEGWDFKRGAQDSSKGPGVGRQYQSARSKLSTRVQKSSSKDGTHVHPERLQRVTGQQKVEKPLHPSWEAARKAKDQKQTASFAGKKVIFD